LMQVVTRAAIIGTEIWVHSSRRLGENL